MIAILYDKSEVKFNKNGICRLSDAISCTVTEERNGIFIAEFEYPIDGEGFSEIQIGRKILCSCDQGGDVQPFEIYSASRPMNGRVIFTAWHVSYRGNFIPIAPFTIDDVYPTQVVIAMEENVMGEIPFDFGFDTDILSHRNYVQNVPASFRSRLGGSEGSFLDLWGGEYKWDYDFVNFRPHIHLYQHRGSDNGVKIRYGKNLVDLTQDESSESLITGVVMYYKDDENFVCSDVFDSSSTAIFTSYSRIQIKDVTESYPEGPPTVSELNDKCYSYLVSHGVDELNVNLTVSFVDLSSTEEYKDVAALERVKLCDIVEVEFERLGVSAKAKVIKTVWNVLLNRYDSIELGQARTNISVQIAEQEERVEEVARNTPSLVDIQAAIDNATAWITGSNGGYVEFVKNSTGKPMEILVMSDDPATLPPGQYPSKIWRWNQNGLGLSTDGGTTYTLAMTADGHFVGDFIAADTLTGDRIIGNTIDTTKLSVTAQRTLAQDEQYIYKTAVEGTTSLPKYETWVTDVNGNQNTWTLKRPQYDKNINDGNTHYPVCFVAKQKKDAVGNVTCTTPHIDDTTTIIDGGNIITNSITAQKLSGGIQSSQIDNLDGTKLTNKINTGNSAIGSIDLSNGDFSLARGNFVYDYANDGDFIQLKNNLSLRLNGIPLAGRTYNNITYHSDISADPYIDVVEYPYMVLVHIKFTLAAGKIIPADSILFSGLQTPYRLTTYTVPLIKTDDYTFSNSMVYLKQIGYIHSGHIANIYNTKQIGNSSESRTYEFNLAYPVDFNTYEP